MVKATGVKTVPSDVFIAAYAGHLQAQGQVELPEYWREVKTAVRRQMPPQSDSWYYTRCASIMRQLYNKPKGVGVGQLARFYGGRTRGHHGKKHFSRSSRGIIRHCLKQMTALGFVDVVEVDEVTVRRLSSKGRQSLDTVAQ